MRALLRIVLILCAAAAVGQNCTDVADESRHEVIHQDKAVRIFRLDLPRLASTDMHCHDHAWLRVVVTNSVTVDTMSGDFGARHEWYPGATRWVFPSRHKARIDTGTPHREYIIETLHAVEYNALDGNYDQDLFFASNADSPSWTRTVTRGPFVIRKVQLAPANAIDVPTPDLLLIALTDVTLAGVSKGDPIRLSKGDYQLLRGGAERTLRNAGTSPAQFITVEF